MCHDEKEREDVISLPSHISILLVFSAEPLTESDTGRICRRYIDELSTPEHELRLKFKQPLTPRHGLSAHIPFHLSPSFYTV